MWRRRCAGVGRLTCLLVALCLALGAAAISGAPTAQASGPGPCDTITSADQAQSSLKQAGGVTAQLSRDQGTIGTALTVTGASWPVGATVLVDVYMKRNGAVFADETLTQAIVSSRGTFTTAQFLAPESGICSSLSETADGRPKDGGSILLLIHTRDGKVRAPVYFTYLTYDLGPQITAQPRNEALTPGTSLSLTGAHWEPGERITITPLIALLTDSSQPSTFQAAPGVAVNTIADDQGAFSATLAALDEPPGTQIEIVAQGTGPRYGTVSVSRVYYQMLPKIFPSIRLDEIAVNAGGALTVTGDNWLPQRPIIIEYCRGENTIPGMVGLRCDPSFAEQLAIVQADESGHFVAHVRLPADARLGSVTVQARIPGAQFGLVVYAQAQPLAIAPTYAEAHPRLTSLAPYIGGGAVVLLGALVALLIGVRMRRRDSSQPAP